VFLLTICGIAKAAKVEFKGKRPIPVLQKYDDAMESLFFEGTNSVINIAVLARYMVQSSMHTTVYLKR
jgi:hypothetical protein